MPALWSDRWDVLVTADAAECGQQPQRDVQVVVLKKTDEQIHMLPFQSCQSHDLLAHDTVHVCVHETMADRKESHSRRGWHVQTRGLEWEVEVQRRPRNAVDDLVTGSQLEYFVVNLHPGRVAHCADQCAFGDRVTHAQNVLGKTTGSRQTRAEEESFPERDDDPQLVVVQYILVVQAVEAETSDVFLAYRVAFERAVDVDA